MSEPVVLLAVTDRVATVTLNRPAARNAISDELRALLRETLASVDSDPDVDVVILTGADPAFCAGLDLEQLGSTGRNLEGGRGDGPGTEPWFPWAPLTKPVIGAINGVAVTGGLEFALNCDILVASDRARFADTHARVGVLPGWGLTVLLPQAVGFGLARRMSLTGDYLNAHDALRAGLVTQVVPHDDLLPAARGVAASIVNNDRDAVGTLLASYRRITAEFAGGAFEHEQHVSREWLKRGSGFDPAEVERRRAGVLARGRSQTSRQHDES